MKNNAFIVNSICLPKPNSEPIGEAVFTGWANIDQNVSKPKTTKSLQKDNYVLVDKQTCHQIWERKIEEDYINPYNDETMICTVFKSPHNHSEPSIASIFLSEIEKGFTDLAIS